jgi:tRNA G10  N-methylase Trm11
MARLAGKAESVWDPFCGSGIELVECALLGGVQRVYGSDRSPEAVHIAEGNFRAAKIRDVSNQWVCCDFRDHRKINGLQNVDVIITNPPMDKRVPIPDLRRLIEDLFVVAAKVLKPGGRLVFANPIGIEHPHPKLRLQSRRVVDMSGFDCRMESYIKV